jgi:hypothetical protein
MVRERGRGVDMRRSCRVGLGLVVWLQIDPCVCVICSFRYRLYGMERRFCFSFVHHFQE